MGQEAVEQMKEEVAEETVEEITEADMCHLDNIPTIQAFALTVERDLIKRSTVVEE
ncbi:hypothetical protein GHT06_007650 [Daphnia sinensis]|uniref:Uncharacterized protein n=1 Tax=Daphnia sinensis TaxID=1820382 RepID=A0AAD5KV98_9CRUS|nr:hypothetical protein GHT06_007650 [Daphnia sinensis]